MDGQVRTWHSSSTSLSRLNNRLKAKRVAKRRSRTEDSLPTEDAGPRLPTEDAGPRPAKRARKEAPEQQPTTSNRPSRPTQIISSLFSYNPQVEIPAKVSSSPIGAPSNAPLDASTFSGLGLSPLLISHLANKMNVHKPTAIQRAALPAFLSPAVDTAARDVFIQSQTGSGKTLSFLLPIIQDVLPLSSLSYIDRSIGTLAVIIAPTRELAKQISDVLEALLKLRLRPEEDVKGESDNSTRLTRWLVSGLLVGGSTRTHEKAKLRKGVPILVSTPGRLLDHLQNTSSFNVGKCRWLVLDEADQLMELGFEETITGIIKGLDGRRRLAKQAIAEGKSAEVGGWDWERRRRTILCSATIREEVQKLAGTALINPLMIKATEADKPTDVLPMEHTNSTQPETFTPPSQLSQKYVVVPLKLRLVALVALLRTLVAQAQSNRGTKIIVFLSCTDSVDFHWKLLAGSTMDDDVEDSGIDSDEDIKAEPQTKPRVSERVQATCSFLPNVSVYRLHGSLPTSTRLASIKAFSGIKSKNKDSSQESSYSVLLCTSVASRGLDLPLVRAVIQYDLPAEGGATEYVHRVGRTARAGKGGEAWSIVGPSEVGWVKWVEEKMQGKSANDTKQNVFLTGVAVESLLRTGFGGKNSEYEERATEVQLAFERWVLRSKDVCFVFNACVHS
jgi:ATP-dependent RNA helicase DDX31/DBP7